MAYPPSDTPDKPESPQDKHESPKHRFTTNRFYPTDLPKGEPEARPNWSDKTDRQDRFARPRKSDKPERLERFIPPEPAEGTDFTERRGRFDRPERPGRFGGSDRDGGFDRPGRFDRPERPGRFGGSDRDGGFDRPGRFGGPRRFERAELEPAESEETNAQYARSRRIAVYGGSFDPIHNGHLMIAQKMLELEKVDEVLFIPALLPPHKTKGLAASPQDRLEMVRLALEPYDKFSYSDIELNRTDTYSYTFDTMAILERIFPDCELHLLIGMDSLQGLHSWYRASELVAHTRFIVYPRPGCDRPAIPDLEKHFGLKNAYKLLESIVEAPELALSTTSSTTIRRATEQHLSVERFVPSSVAQYIREHQLYTQPENN